MRDKDPENVLFGSLNEYMIESKDRIWYKALVIVYLEKRRPLDFVVTSSDYYEAIDLLSKTDAIKSKNYKSMVPFSKFCIYCADKLRNLHYTSMKKLDDDVVLRFRNTDVLDKTSAKIDPDAKQRRDFLDTQGRALTDLIKKGEI